MALDCSPEFLEDESHVFSLTKILWTCFEKCNQGYTSVKLFQNLTCGFREEFIRIPSCLCSASSFHSPEHVSQWIKILHTFFEKVHPRNISVKIFQNLTSHYREEKFIRISLCVCIVQVAPIHYSHDS